MSEQPENAIELAADAAFNAVKDFLSERGASLNLMYVALYAGGLDEERDSVIAATGEELPEDPQERIACIFGFLLSEAKSAGKAMGLDVRLLPIDKPVGRG